jgi:PAS domain S-box-containing protein
MTEGPIEIGSLSIWPRPVLDAAATPPDSGSRRQRLAAAAGPAQRAAGDDERRDMGLQDVDPGGVEGDDALASRKAPTARPIRVVVAEDEKPLRDALAALIVSEEGFELVGTAMEAGQAIEVARTTSPDVVLVDVKMPNGGGRRAAREITGSCPGTRVVALSAYADRVTVVDMLRAGAVGYLVKGVSPNEILEAIARASRGQASLSLEMTAEVIEALTGDIAQHRESEEQLRRSEERIRELIESAPDAVVIVDAYGQIALVNERTEKMFGYRRGELLGRRIELLLPERFRERHAEHRKDYLDDPVTRPMGAGLELAGRRKDGTEFPVDISLSALSTDEGQLATAFIRDISDRVRQEDARRATEERFALLLESAPDAVIRVDRGGRIVFANAQTEKLFEYRREELVGKRIEMLLPERFRERHVAHRLGYFETRVTRPMGVGLELAGRRRDGSEFPIDISLSAVETEDGLMATAFIRDITERKAEAELQQTMSDRRALAGHILKASERERQRIAADIHDDSIQTIAAAGLRLQLLRRTLEDEQHIELLGELEEAIQTSIVRLRRLIFELRPVALDHEGIAQALRILLDEMSTDDEIRYQLDSRDLASEPPEDARLVLFRIAKEALTNVRKHAHAKTVRLHLASQDDGYVVRITDDGVGFEPDGDEEEAGHIGLVSMRERADLVGGWLRIDSDPQTGTTVECWVPAQSVEAFAER